MHFGERSFDCVILADFEYGAQPGDRPTPVCLVVRDLVTGKTQRYWMNELVEMKQPPFPIGERAVFIAYLASAELSCFEALGWPFPTYVIDLYVEFRKFTNGVQLHSGATLLGALAYFGHDSLSVVHKEQMRTLALRGGNYSEQEKQGLLDYCESDVVGLEKLFWSMHKDLDFGRALLRGRYMKAVARIEATGIPIDVESLAALRVEWPNIQDELIRRVDHQFAVFEGKSFKRDRFLNYLDRSNIPWPMSELGQPCLDIDTFRQMAKAYPQLAPLCELKSSLSQLRLEGLLVGKDRRNRTMLGVFQARTSRNQPSNTKFVFGPSVWTRNLIKPEPGHALAYIDWSQQEFGIAAALSGDAKMLRAYESGDPYLAFAVQAGAAPANATKASHKNVREQFKACVLAVQYGMGSASLATRIGQPAIKARELLQLHRETYRQFWKWSDAVADHAMMFGFLDTVFGWRIRVVGEDANPRSLRNFPMQANGAEMLRLACCFATERGVSVCAPVHDAVLIEASESRIVEGIATTQQAMSDASAAVLNGFRLRTDVKLVHAPGRYEDDRGVEMWATVWDIIRERGAKNGD